MKRWIAAVLAWFLIVSGALADAEKQLIIDLYNALGMTAERAEETIEKDLEALDHDPLLTAVAGHWKDIFLDPDYRIYDFRKDDPSALEIETPIRHAFVVLGYCLKDGAMEEELKERCRAAAKIAKAYRRSIVICTGGRTGINNPYGNTEAGEMCAFLVDVCGISPSRIYLDRKALTTVDNVRNTFEILRKKGIETITVVTSKYHIRWATVLFCAAAEMYRRGEDPYEVQILGNWCCDVTPPAGYDDLNALTAAYQLRTLLAGR